MNLIRLLEQSAAATALFALSCGQATTSPAGGSPTQELPTSVPQALQTEAPIPTSVESRVRWHGPFAIFPAGTDTDLIEVEPGQADPALAHADIMGADVPAFDSFESIPPGLQKAVRGPAYVPSGLNLDSVRVVSEGDRLLQSTSLWFREPSTPRDLAHADLLVTRTLAMAPPVVVLEPGIQQQGGGIRAWAIEPVFVGKAHALFHDFESDPNVDRVSQQSDGLQWFDEEGYFNAVIAWDMSFDEMLKVAESIGR